MRDFGLNAPVELTVAAEPGMMLIIRLTTAGVVTRAGLSIDVMDSLKIAVEEACVCLIGQDSPPERLALRFDCGEDALRIRADALDAGEGGEGMDEAEMDVVRCILESLADDVAFHLEDGRIRAIELRSALR